MRPAAPAVVVLGGGPAGAAVARALALWGHPVQLIALPPVQPSLVVSIPPSTTRVLEALDLRDMVARAGFIQSRGNTVRWGQAPVREEVFADGQTGWQAPLDRLTEVLQQAAQAAGVVIQTRRATASDAAGGGAAWTIDCTGRAGILARARGLRIAEPAHRTVALVGRWRVGDAGHDATHTWIESYRDGWAWSVPDADGTRHIAVMVDPRTSELARGRSARGVYEAEVGKTAWLSRMAAAARFVGGPVGWDASMYHASSYAADHILLVGDAGSFVDPLSSAGVKKALVSAWLAAVAAHTALAAPEMATVACTFFHQREVEMYTALRALTARHLSEGAGAAWHPFWGDRFDSAAASGWQPDPAACEAAFDRLRAASRLAVRVGPGWHVAPGPVIRGRRIVLEPQWVHPSRTRHVRYERGVDLVVLLDLAPAHHDVAQLWDAYNRRTAPAPLPDLLAALSAALADGLLVWTGDPAATG